jgi:hypothetical protein
MMPGLACEPAHFGQLCSRDRLTGGRASDRPVQLGHQQRQIGTKQCGHVSHDRTVEKYDMAQSRGKGDAGSPGLGQDERVGLRRDGRGDFSIAQRRRAPFPARANVARRHLRTILTCMGEKPRGRASAAEMRDKWRNRASGRLDSAALIIRARVL